MECLLREHNIVTMVSTVPRMAGWNGQIEETIGCEPLSGEKEPPVGIYDKVALNSRDAEPDLMPMDNKMDKPFQFRCKVAAPCRTMQGHTGYLTFASLMPQLSWATWLEDNATFWFDIIMLLQDQKDTILMCYIYQYLFIKMNTLKEKLCKYVQYSNLKLNKILHINYVHQLLLSFF